VEVEVTAATFWMKQMHQIKRLYLIPTFAGKGKLEVLVMQELAVTIQ